jgi:4-nitrophenyl phosphatase
MLECIVEKFHLDRTRSCMVGDRLDTDIAFGHHGGLKTLLVMTGVAKRADLIDTKHTLPDFVADIFSVLLLAKESE